MLLKTRVVGTTGRGYLKKIWPNVKYLETIATGSMAQYIPLIEYYSGGLPLMSVKYGSSECDLGFNLNPICDPYNVSYTIMPNMAYYEFLPLESLDNCSSNLELKTVDMANVEVGKEYEVVVTTYAGLYRYRLGDVLSPTSFYNSTPQFKFVRKRDVLLCIDVAKITEIDLQNAIDNASSLLRPFDTKVAEYTSNADVNNIPGHYVIYVELTTTNRANREILEQCCVTMEHTFGALYKSSRVAESVGPLEIRIVNNGTFEKLRDYAISKGASFIQYKVPRCVTLLPMLELLNNEVVSTHFSPWVPDNISCFPATFEALDS
ncbi:hypothetical protein RND81_14G221000 [Saponaria officinalis]|uniref:Uncharacterized protein n=1 Tax=Saponaria officinalis TaxID=3572 RepID=A0AAW1GT72_SAPOF